MMGKTILIREVAGLARAGEYLRVALPCARGEFPAGAPLRLLDERGTPRPCQSRVLKEWPDGSAKWLLVDFAASVPPRTELAYRVEQGAPGPAAAQRLAASPEGDGWRVDTGAGTFLVDGRTFRPFAAVLYRGKACLDAGEASCLLAIDGEELQAGVERIELEEEGALHAVLRVSGDFGGRAQGVRFSSRLHFYAGTMQVAVEFTLHNPRRAMHPGGLWDLGDAGAILFKELSLRFPLAAGTTRETRLSLEPGAEPLRAGAGEGISLYQESSGGENWRSANHRNSAGVVPMKRRGYVASAAGGELTGERATPLVWCGHEGGGVAAALPRFWQEFPKGIEASCDLLKISLFPPSFPDLYELQGGEQKTHAFTLDFAATPESLSWALAPLQAVASPGEYRACGIFHDLPGKDDPVDRLSTPAEILRKREALDEYGWRNFGELYADHETVYHQGGETFVSHYNNQYDFCAGAYRKFFASGDFAWQELAADLARHVADIDIYHTEADREEYNGGLFWHTDHYIDAGLASHRSYSREHLRTKRETGGGPSAQHCYTTGLMLHYFQTGDPSFRLAVLGLADWVYRALHGTGTVLETLKRGVSDLLSWRLSRGEGRLYPRYPLTRGTGNAITACLDAFELGGGRTYLERAEELVRGALHPEDDLAARHLLDAEVAWSYTVLLAAVAKYLAKKRELGELDGGYSYAAASFLHYARWMAQHEYPYLEKPEILEFPNETWAAQDLRKAVIFYHAGLISPPEERPTFWNRGRHFVESAMQELMRRETSRFARPLTLVLQNGWAAAALAGAEDANGCPAGSGEVRCGRPTPPLTLGAVSSRIAGDLVRAVRSTTIGREIAWLRRRLGK